MPDTLLLVLLGAIGAGGGIALGISVGRRNTRERMASARAEAKTIRKSGKLEAGALRRAVETEAREAALVSQDQADLEDEAAHADLGTLEEQLLGQVLECKDSSRELDDRREDISERESAVQGQRDRASGLRRDAEQKRETTRGSLEERCETSGDEIVSSLTAAWIEEAHANAAQAMRTVEQSLGDPSHAREAEHLMLVATSRYQNHFLIDRSISNVPIENGVADVLIGNDNRILDALAKGANIQLHINETGQSVKLEGLDGVGREVARRALKGLGKKPKALAQAKEDPEQWVQTIRARLDTEIQGLGKKAFSVLKVPKAHPEIVSLVGRLNYRTSYTQNQWLHAVEAAFLAGMIAEELGLDVRIARRATLLHDIGKALTHEIEGSHAVIGADIARRHNESEMVVNAIESHHADVPPTSAYAHLVAAADAMSGARPGARREQTEGYSTRLEDLERLGAAHRGVESCSAVHGGRELRIYVRDNEVSELGAVEMSTSIAEQISEEMTFPGQVKVTVIRSSESVSVAS